MDVSNLLSHDGPSHPVPQQTNNAPLDQTYNHQYLTRRSTATQNHSDQPMATTPARQFYHSATSEGHASASPPKPKNLTFELHFDGIPRYKARLPMRVQIFPHDTTDSIISTVKNFYGLYEGAANGVSFEDAQGNTLIAQYENFRDGMVVYMRVVPDYSSRQNSYDGFGHSGYRSTSPRRLPQLDDVPQMLPPQPAQILNYGQPPSRPASRLSRKQSASPRLGGRPSRANSSQKIRSRSGVKSQSSSFQANLDELNGDAHNGYSSSDGGAGSVTSSRKARSEQLASAEISVENIVEGGRRKRAKFESSVSCINCHLGLLGSFAKGDPFCRNCLSSSHPKLQHPTRFHRSLLNVVLTAMRMLRHSLAPRNVHSHTMFLSSLHKAILSENKHNLAHHNQVQHSRSLLYLNMAIASVIVLVDHCHLQDPP